MRDFFIRFLEIIINVLVVIVGIAIVIAAGAAAFAPDMITSEFGAVGGPLTGLLILVGGGLYLAFVAGFMYLGLGIYRNTKRAAELLETRRRL